MNPPVQALIESQQRARQRLAQAKAQATRLQRDAESDALKLLIGQQEQAEQLLERQQASMGEMDLSPEEERVLVAKHRKAAELLMQSQKDIAIHVADAMEGRVAIVLLQGSREAAAILMEAWAQVKDALSDD